MNKISAPVKEASSLKIWHRRMGLSAAIFVLILAITGLCLNHANDWGLDDQYIELQTMLNWYGINQPDLLSSYPLGSKLVTKVGDEVFLDTREVAHCSGDLQGAVELPAQGIVVIACDGELFVLSDQYEMIERLGAVHGLPQPLIKIGLNRKNEQKNDLILLSGNRYFTADLDKLSWVPISDVETIGSVHGQAKTDIKELVWSEPIATPSGLTEVLGKHFVGEGISLERVLLDIHSGRIVGAWGTYLVDVMAILFVVLAVTGFLMWLREAPKGR